MHTFEKPIKPNGGLVILKGNLAPEGCVMKIAAAGTLRTSRAGARFRLRRRLLQGGAGGRHQARRRGGDSLRRAEGRAGHARDAAGDGGYQLERGVERARWRCLTDGRFSGATRGFTAGHVAPEAFVGGPIAAVREGDMIHFDIPKRTLNVEISDAEMAARLKELQAAGVALAAGRLPQVCGSRDLGV